MNDRAMKAVMTTHLQLTILYVVSMTVCACAVLVCMDGVYGSFSRLFAALLSFRTDLCINLLVCELF